jgi:hypothetical protein
VACAGHAGSALPGGGYGRPVIPLDCRKLVLPTLTSDYDFSGVVPALASKSIRLRAWDSSCLRLDSLLTLEWSLW